MAGDDPTAIRSIAISAADVVDAFVYSRENPGNAVLRVTPPFHGRMRARLHVYHRDDSRLTGAVHVEPADLLPADVVAAYPSFEAFADRADAVDPAEIREARGEAIETWRDRAADELVASVVLEADGERVRVDVKRLE
ncbi:hypothetical protein [Halovivax sp.]|uniref:hypothetical protein n=1 Tax=Halovivax sp. TaxID=1935978 RepID=UPI0025C477FB|nr:hypothetical protein [Halovivax sp.]